MRKAAVVVLIAMTLRQQRKPKVSAAKPDQATDSRTPLIHLPFFIPAVCCVFCLAVGTFLVVVTIGGSSRCFSR